MGSHSSALFLYLFIRQDDEQLEQPGEGGQVGRKRKEKYLEKKGFYHSAGSSDGAGSNYCVTIYAVSDPCFPSSFPAELVLFTTSSVKIINYKKELALKLTFLKTKNHKH